MLRCSQPPVVSLQILYARTYIINPLHYPYFQSATTNRVFGWCALTVNPLHQFILALKEISIFSGTMKAYLTWIQKVVYVIFIRRYENYLNRMILWHWDQNYLNIDLSSLQNNCKLWCGSTARKWLAMNKRQKRIWTQFGIKDKAKISCSHSKHK